jgi:hypothetical protein
LLIPGLFDGEHSFVIQPVGPDRVRLTQHERFRGVLVPVLFGFLAKPTLAGFQQMNQPSRVAPSSPAARRCGREQRQRCLGGLGA